METNKLVLELLRQLQNGGIDEFKFARDKSNPEKVEIWVNGGIYIDRRLINSSL